MASGGREHLEMSTQPPSRKLPFVLTLLAIIGSGAFLLGMFARHLEPLERAYLATYLKAQYLPTASSFGLREKPKRYSVITVNGRDMTSATLPGTAKGIGVRYTTTTPALFSEWLRLAVYDGKTGVQLARIPLILWGILSLLAIIAGVCFAIRQREKLLSGMKLRGPSFMTVRQFNRITKGDGFALHVK